MEVAGIVLEFFTFPPNTNVSLRQELKEENITRRIKNNMMDFMIILSYYRLRLLVFSV